MATHCAAVAGPDWLLCTWTAMARGCQASRGDGPLHSGVLGSDARGRRDGSLLPRCSGLHRLRVGLTRHAAMGFRLPISSPGGCDMPQASNCLRCDVGGAVWFIWSHLRRLTCWCLGDTRRAGSLLVRRLLMQSAHEPDLQWHPHHRAERDPVRAPQPHPQCQHGLHVPAPGKLRLRRAVRRQPRRRLPLPAGAQRGLGRARELPVQAGPRLQRQRAHRGRPGPGALRGPREDCRAARGGLPVAGEGPLANAL
mmetsp:Transcript_62125/g.176466  ORF Transcript_62125/g.176466 Transcript_62125/m.176466 type:complete len:253 (+) Transcript_62125:529-1287(+)